MDEAEEVRYEAGGNFLGYWLAPVDTVAEAMSAAQAATPSPAGLTRRRGLSLRPWGLRGGKRRMCTTTPRAVKAGQRSASTGVAATACSTPVSAA
eukprot:15286002-Alexandrium_andersonii.AAC.1